MHSAQYLQTSYEIIMSSIIQTTRETATRRKASDSSHVHQQKTEQESIFKEAFQLLLER